MPVPQTEVILPHDAERDASEPKQRQRFVSLDVLRGLAVMGMILVNSTASLKEVHEVDVLPWLLHARWEGLTMADLVFPAFLMIMGVSIPLAFRRAKFATGLTGDLFKRIFWRSVRLILLGLILTNLDVFADPSEVWRPWDVLQRIGIVYGACAILYFRCRPRTLGWIVVASLLLYWPLSLVPALDGLPNDIWQRGHNFVASVDRVMLGAGDHIWVEGPEGYDPEGLLGTWPAIAHGLIGVLIGEIILLGQKEAIARRLAAVGAAMLAAGICWGFVFPIIKDLWSSSFVLVTCGITTLVLAGLHALLDTGKVLRGAWAFLVNIPLAFGLNAIAAYVLHEVLDPMLGWHLAQAPLRWATPTVGEPMAALLPVILFVVFIWLCVDYLRRKKWIIQI